MYYNANIKSKRFKFANNSNNCLFNNKKIFYVVINDNLLPVKFDEEKLLLDLIKHVIDSHKLEKKSYLYYINNKIVNKKELMIKLSHLNNIYKELIIYFKEEKNNKLINNNCIDDDCIKIDDKNNSIYKAEINIYTTKIKKNYNKKHLIGGINPEKSYLSIENNKFSNILNFYEIEKSINLFLHDINEQNCCNITDYFNKKSIYLKFKSINVAFMVYIHLKKLYDKENEILVFKESKDANSLQLNSSNNYDFPFINSNNLFSCYNVAIKILNYKLSDKEIIELFNIFTNKYNDILKSYKSLNIIKKKSTKILINKDKYNINKKTLVNIINNINDRYNDIVENCLNKCSYNIVYNYIKVKNCSKIIDTKSSNRNNNNNNDTNNNNNNNNNDNNNNNNTNTNTNTNNHNIKSINLRRNKIMNFNNMNIDNRRDYYQYFINSLSEIKNDDIKQNISQFSYKGTNEYNIINKKHNRSKVILDPINICKKL